MESSTCESLGKLPSISSMELRLRFGTENIYFLKIFSGAENRAGNATKRSGKPFLTRQRKTLKKQDGNGTIMKWASNWMGGWWWTMESETKMTWQELNLTGRKFFRILSMNSAERDVLTGNGPLTEIDSTSDVPGMICDIWQSWKEQGVSFRHKNTLSGWWYDPTNCFAQTNQD